MKMPFPHLYVTVDFEKENSEDAIKNEIDEKLKWKASKYIELRYKALKEAKFRMLSNIEAQRTESSSGTLTMFCLKNDMYYALTCAHAGVVNYLDERQERYSDGDQFVEIQESYIVPVKEDSMEYFYNGQPIVPVPDQTRVVSNEEVDIMYIVIGRELAVNNQMTLNLDLEGASDEIYEIFFYSPNDVRVRTADAILGDICDPNWTYCSPNSKQVVYQNAVLVQSSNQSIDSGDSGALVYFLNEENNWKPFAYLVAEFTDYDPVSSRPRKNYICLKLDKALNALNLDDAEYFTDYESNLVHQPDEGQN
ncbi:uncharacterized protein LOC124437878 [Xenia sp. Carnegie-2017]|uniref:uncharacterized protein LOC124437878 n=1 Tax=Xenia sp. Carnegie-2017 TaxID=2897299 RepID=UPI001F049103|nr:uncharacterized protein LOC124437878 [Xenia sp. Carnegie-2017]